MIYNANEAEKIVKGTFIVENKNRFLCEVNIAGIKTICYVPSTCRLDKLISLPGKEVLLLPTVAAKKKTAYSLYAVAHKRNYIVLNASLANRLVENNIHSRRFSFLGKRVIVLREHIHDGYKCDLFIKDTKTIIEVKSIISACPDAHLFSVNSHRAMQQLHFLETYLNRGFPVCYVIVAFNPYTERIILNPSNLLHKKLMSCMACGMELYAMSGYLDAGKLRIKKRIEIIT